MNGFADFSEAYEHDPRFEWSRDPRWMPMPPTASNTIHLLAGVSNDDSNYFALKVTAIGGYTVDWGDGTVDNVASNTNATHKYTYSSVTSVIDAGYLKQAMITIAPQTPGNDITAIDLGVRYSSAVHPYPMLLDAQINTPGLTSFTAYGTCFQRWLERIVFKAVGNITSLNNAFHHCRALRVVEFPVGSLQNVTTMEYAFGRCTSLLFIKFPPGSLALVEYPRYAFIDCNMLKEVEFPDGAFAAAKSTYQMFYQCNMLEYVKFPTAMPDVTNTSYMFSSCQCLTIIDFAPGSFGAVTTAASMFGADSLRRIKNFSFPLSFTVPGKMAAEELNEIYTALPTVTGKTITVTGHPGVSGDDPTIATAKGWTVTGS